MLAGLLFPVFGRSLRHAKTEAELSQLRQIGLSASLYAEEHGRFPLSVLDFKGGGLWGSPIWAGEVDPFREGFRNRLLTSLASGDKKMEHNLKRVVPYKTSFVGIEDLFEGLPTTRDIIELRPNAGWLVSFDEQDLGALDEPSLALGGRFTRLNIDGSVVKRPSQKRRSTMNYPWLFSDATDEQKDEDLKADSR